MERQNRYSVGPQNLATGNRVYRGFSNSPHSGGGLNKDGYKTRDDQAKRKRDMLIGQLKKKGF